MALAVVSAEGGWHVRQTEGRSQLLAADLCKYGLWNLAPILIPVPSSVPWSIPGAGARWRVDFCACQ